ncbi:galactokinase [Dendrosporobacter sp. 1207_IL3150]|uniref:galactokinase n=1 Tax=Dendrosporobacter sp. 1207_IL3150 TaxID=3084054 RepID=UPI002FDB05F5
MKADLGNKFIEMFGPSKLPIKRYFAPGRVNLIGEYTDFNGGYVFPAAISLGIWGLLRQRTDSIINFRSLNMSSSVSIDLNQPVSFEAIDGWANYPKGIIKYLIDHGYELKGCDILYYGELPEGTGLSSSAAILVLTAFMLQHAFSKDKMDRVELAKSCRSVENNFIGVNCGIMDHFTIAHGQRDQAILLDCNNLNYSYIPFVLEKYRLVIMNTNKKRELTDSKYNERRKECDQAFTEIRKNRHIENLCQAYLNEVEVFITNPAIRKRARHVISENIRVSQAVRLLCNGDLTGFGNSMIASHKSLQQNFEVSGPELDSIVEHAISSPGCIGARMTGAGFGGCAIALVENGKIDDFITSVGAGYKHSTGRTAEFYIAVISEGVRYEGYDGD